MIENEMLMRKAIEIFRLHGTRFTMDEISESLGISKRTLYDLVTSKENLIKMAINYYFDSINKIQAGIYHDSSLDIIQKLKLILTSLPKTASVEYSKLTDIKKNYSHLFNDIDLRLTNGWELTYSLIDEAVKEGILIKFDKELFKRIYVSAIENVIINYNIELKTYKEVLEEIVDILLNGIKARC
ncbi:MAG: TetR/AcrR family transcriptional regulator [Clostridia bacterium]|nr:TetR/AcrR family transcriptional regulator [Clostridia bacterium]